MTTCLASHSRRRALACALVALSVGTLSFSNAGCKRKKVEAMDAAPAAKVPTLDDVIAEYKPKLDPKFASVVKIGANLPHAAAHEGLKPEKGAIHLLAGDTRTIANGGDGGSQTANATIVHAEDIKGGALWSRYPRDFSVGEALLHDCSAIMEKKDLVTKGFTPSYDTKSTARVLTQCASFVYLLVVRTASQALPTVDETAHTYSAGHIEGDVIVFDIDSGKSIGGYKFSARNPHDMKLNVSDPLSGLMKDVREKMWTSIRDGFEKLAPGSNVITEY